MGISAVVVRDGKLLLGKRKNTHGQGQWATPGGHLEYGEDVAACACRELIEETGLKAHASRLGPWVSNVIENKHYITLFVIVEEFEGELELREPEKCEGWEWFDFNCLPSPLFGPIRSFVEKL